MPFPTAGNLPDPGIELMFLVSPVFAGRFFTTSTPWETDPSSKKTCRWPRGTWKDVQHHSLIDENPNYNEVSPHTRLSSKIPQIINSGESVERKEPSYSNGRNVNWYGHYGEQYRGSLRNQQQSYLIDYAIPPLGIYPEKNTVPKDTCTPVFIAAQFTIAKNMEET